MGDHTLQSQYSDSYQPQAQFNTFDQQRWPQHGGQSHYYGDSLFASGSHHGLNSLPGSSPQYGNDVHLSYSHQQQPTPYDFSSWNQHIALSGHHQAGPSFPVPRTYYD
ncbi:hypothetical protein CBS101457_000150 [Exobasidium rhododendri]|nr:hypothetical protein CBS101457_000150 [Exobasidium rhododendri]